MVSLDKNELFLYCDPIFIKLSLILQTEDTSSYVFMESKKKDEQYNQDYKLLNKQIIEFWFSRYRIEKVKKAESRDK